MNDFPQLPTGAKRDPDHPEWYSWGEFTPGSFAAATGKLLFRPEGPGRGRARMFVEPQHLNLGGSIHGGAVMSFIDMSLFAGGRCAGMAEGHYVTLDLTTHFIGRGQAGKPLDAHVEIVQQTRTLCFMQGVCTQDDEPRYSFTGTLKRITPKG